MKTGSKNHELPVIFAATIMGLAMLACTCNLLTQPNNPGQGTPTKRPGNITPGNGSDPGTPSPTQPDNGTQAACLASIFPGTTTREEAVASLGEPVGVVPDGDFETLLYASPLPRQYNSIVMQNQVVALVSIILGDDNPLAWSAILAQYGEPVHTTYSNYIEGSMTYIYPDKGQAFVASQDSDVVFLRQCFVPMALEDYLNTWGSSLPTGDPYIR